MSDNNRSMPHSDALEQSVLFACLNFQDQLVIALEQLRIDDFYAQRSKDLFDIISRRARTGGTVDPLIIREACRGNNNALTFMEELKVWIGTDITPLCVQLRELSAARRLTRAACEVAESGLGSAPDPTTFLDVANETLTTALQSREASAKISTAADVVYEIGFDLTQRSPEEANKLIPTGLTGLDGVLGGWEQGRLYVPAGRPGMGKTAFVMQSVISAASIGKRCAVYSIEMTEKLLTKRALASMARINSRMLRPGVLNYDQTQRVLKQAERFASLPIVFPESSGIRIEEIVRSARQLKLRGGLDLVVVDYLQLIESSGKHDNREQEVSSISRQLKRLARMLEIPVIACAQLSRKVEDRGDKRPQLSDLRESGAIEQDADVIMFLYREDYYARGTTQKNGQCEIIVAKNRDGETGYVKALFEPEFTRFADLEQYA